MNIWAVFEKSIEQLPSKDEFYSSLTDRQITDKEYEHFVNVSNKIKMKNMKYYHELYLKCDVLSLADVFKNFRNYSLKNTWAHQI